MSNRVINYFIMCFNCHIFIFFVIFYYLDRICTNMPLIGKFTTITPIYKINSP